MSFNVTTLRDIVNPLQYVSEASHSTVANFGVTPTASPIFTAAGINTEIQLNPDVTYEAIQALGQEDIIDSVKTGELYAFNLKSNIFDVTLADYGIAAVNAAGTAADSLSFLFSKKIDGTTYYTIMKGARPISTTLSLARGPWVLDQTWVCKEIIDETTSHGLTTPTLITTVPTTTPWVHSDITTVPFTWNSTTFQDKRFSMTIKRDLARLDVNGQVLTQFTKVSNRKISFSVDVFKKSTAILTDYYDHTSRTASYVLKSGAGAKTATFTAARLTDYSENHSGTNTDAAIESISGISESVAIA